MRAIEAETFSGYRGLRQIELPQPQPAKDRVLVRVTAAGVTPLDHTILSGGHPRAKAPLVLGNEGAGVIEDAGDSGLAVGSRVMFTGTYGVRENGAWRDIILLIADGSVKPIVERVYPLGDATGALRHLIEDRPFGKVVLAG
jgi:NADPH:quinone reductase